MSDSLYQLDPTTVVFPYAEHCVVQRLGQQDVVFFTNTTAVTQFLSSFARPATLGAVRTNLQSVPSYNPRGLDQKTFDHLADSFVKCGVLREFDSETPSVAAASDSDLNPAKAMLATINLLAEDITGDISAMGTAALSYAEEQTGEELHRILLRTAGELTRVATALAARRKTYLEKQLAPLRQSAKLPRLHLGAGGNNLDGWYNIDFAPAELAMNLRWALPFNSNSIEYVYLAHLFEHLYKRRDAPALLKEILRVLKPGGVVRIIVPDAGVYMRAYVENDDGFFAMQKQVWFTWAPKARTRLEAILGYLGAPEAPGGLAQHKYGYDFPTLKILLDEAGFTAVEQSTFMQSAHPDLRIDDRSFVTDANVDGRYASLFVEARK